jgi:hypothetical protein
MQSLKIEIIQDTLFLNLHEKVLKTNRTIVNLGQGCMIIFHSLALRHDFN